MPYADFTPLSPLIFFALAIATMLPILYSRRLFTLALFHDYYA